MATYTHRILLLDSLNASNEEYIEYQDSLFTELSSDKSSLWTNFKYFVAGLTTAMFLNTGD